MILSKKILSILLPLFIIIVIFSLGATIYAQTTVGLDSQTGMGDISAVYGSANQDLRVVAAKIVRTCLGFLAVVFVGLLLFSGFQYMVSGGNEEKTKNAMSTIKNSIIGLVIVFTAWSIAQYIILLLTKATHT